MIRRTASDEFLVQISYHSDDEKRKGVTAKMKKKKYFTPKGIYYHEPVFEWRDGHVPYDQS